MDNKRLIATALLEIAQRSKTTFLEVGKKDKELIDAAKKIGIELPSPDLLVMKTVYAQIDKVNKNGVILPKKAVEKGLGTLVGKQCNWEHEGSGFVCGYTISKKINGDEIETINVLFKSLFPEQVEELKEKVKSGEAAVSFEIYNVDPETGKSVVKELDNGYKEISPIIFHGTGVLLTHEPACPTAKIFQLVANKLTNTADKVMNQIFAPDLIYASLALEDKEEASFKCQCLKCGKVISSDKHCKDIKCPSCGGTMRRKDRPGKGQPTAKSNEVKVIIKQIESKIWICPYCDKEIGEKELFLDEKTKKWYHRSCQDKGEIILPKKNINKKEESKVAEKVKKVDKISKETKPEQKATETKPAEVGAETKVEETKGEETKEVKTEVKPKETLKPEIKEKVEKPEAKAKVEKKAEEKKEEVTKEKKEVKAEETEVIEPKIRVKVTTESREVRVSTYIDGTPSGTDEVKYYSKTITEYSDGTKDEVENELETKNTYTFAELEEAVKKAKEELTKLHKAELEAKTNEAKTDLDKKIKEKDTEISKLQKELDAKAQEITKAKVEENKPELTVGDVNTETKSEITIAKEKINNIIANKRKQK